MNEPGRCRMLAVINQQDSSLKWCRESNMPDVNHYNKRGRYLGVKLVRKGLKVDGCG